MFHFQCSFIFDSINDPLMTLYFSFLGQKGVKIAILIGRDFFIYGGSEGNQNPCDQVLL